MVDALLEENGICEEKLEIDTAYAVKVNASEEQLEELVENRDVVVSEDIVFDAASKKTKKSHKHSKKNKEKNDVEWNIKMINADEENVKSSETRIKVAILDSGVDLIDEIDVKESINLIPEEQNVDVPGELKK